VLKIDGTCAGEGVRIVDSHETAGKAFRELSRPAGLATALKRTIINGDTLSLWAWQNAGAPGVTAQRFVTGHPANAMLACFRGRLLGAVCVEVLSSEGPTGAAIIIRLLDSPPMVRAAEQLVKRLGLTGFCGLDFVIDDATSIPYLIEMNPRCTQLGHLSLPGQGDLAGLLLATLPGGAVGAPPAPIAAGTIALFPQYLWAGGAAAVSRPGVQHDVPRDYPDLVAELSKPAWPERRWIARAYHFFRSQRRVPMLDFPVGSVGTGPELAKGAELAPPAAPSD
jgi:ATP-grasp domain